jgi:glycerophosphoryl diester phosphodiesterase
MRNKKLVIIGHRGAHGLAPENTIKGFEKALEYGVDMIETDVVVTKDNILILQHDFMHSADGKKWWTRDYTLEEIRDRKPDVITLEQGIEFVNRRTRLMLDMKRGADTEAVIEIIKKYLKRGWQASDFMFNSNNFGILSTCHLLMPDVEIIVQANWKGVRAIRWARKFQTPYILLDQRYLWWGFVAMVSKHYKLATYTYPRFWDRNFNHHKAAKWAKYGLWGIVTDYPDKYAKRRKGVS